MNILRLSAIFLITMILIPDSASAHCKGKHTGNHPHCSGEPPPPPPPPTGCVDDFPGFLYMVEAGRNTPAELHLSSTDGCRSELIAVVPDIRQHPAMHMTANGSEGLILWQEDPGQAEYIVRRQDFTVNGNGDLTLVGSPVTVLPLAGEEAAAGDYLYYFFTDIWGDAIHGSLYLAISRQYVFNSGPNLGESTEELLVYNLNDLTSVNALPEVREIYRTPDDPNGWNCPSDPSVLNPQFVPTCYGVDGIRFNPSGTRLYIRDNIDDLQGQRWDGTVRIDIDMGSGSLANWILSAPELVYTGTTEFEPVGMLARPDATISNLPNPEIIGMGYLDRSGNQTVRAGAFLNADQCAAAVYAPLSGGNLSGLPDLWMQCIDNQLLNGTGRDSWQSPEAFLTSRLVKRHYNIYRRYVTGALAGTEQLLIEDGRFADTGF